MSHNILKVNNNNVSNNNVSLNLSDLCSVSNIQTNDIIKHNGTNFINSTAGGGFSNASLYYQNHESTWNTALGTWTNYEYVNGNYYLGGARVTDRYAYSDSSITANNSTATNSFRDWTNGQYKESYTVATAGTYLCIYFIECKVMSQATFRWQSNAGFFGAKVTMTNSGNGFGSCVVGIVNASQNDVLRVIIDNTIGVGYKGRKFRQSNYTDYCDQVTILKLP